MEHAFYDALETQPHEKRVQELLKNLPRQVAFAKNSTQYYAELLQGIDAQAITSLKALEHIPVTRKSDLLKIQQAQRSSDVFGGFSAVKYGKQMPRVFSSPGPIYEPQGGAEDFWRLARAMYAAGFRTNDLVYNTFSYHFVPAGAMMESGAHALGCSVFPAGVGQTEQQIQAINHLKPTAYAGTPSFLRIILEKMREQRSHCSDTLSFKKALFSGEAYPPSLQQWFAEYGIAGFQCYATADVGLIAYETSAKQGLVISENILLEIVRPGSNQAVPVGEVGEVVVTVFNDAYPLIRFGTGDLSAIMEGNCPTGRTNLRLKGWMGRADQTTKVRGMFIHPEQVYEIIQKFPQVSRARLVVSGEMANDVLTLMVQREKDCVLDQTQFDQLQVQLEQAVRDITKLRAQVKFNEGMLPNDGKIIEDLRSYK